MQLIKDIVRQYKTNLIKEGKFDQGILKALVIIGAPNVGKSSYAEKIKNGIIFKPKIYDSDTIVEFLAEKHQVNIKDWKDPNTQSIYKIGNPKSTYQLHLWIAELLPVIVLLAPSDIQRLKYRIGILEHSGYDVRILIVKPTNPERNLRELNAIRRRGVDPLYAEQALKLTDDMIEYCSQHYETNIIPDIQSASQETISNVVRNANIYFKSIVQNDHGRDLLNILYSNPSSKNMHDIDPDKAALALKWYEKPYKNQEQQ